MNKGGFDSIPYPNDVFLPFLFPVPQFQLSSLLVSVQALDPKANETLEDLEHGRVVAPKRFAAPWGANEASC